jgi:hypothetical protein
MRGQQEQEADFPMGTQSLMLVSKHKAVLQASQERYDKKYAQLLADKQLDKLVLGAILGAFGALLLTCLFVYGLLL